MKTWDRMMLLFKSFQNPEHNFKTSTLYYAEIHQIQNWTASRKCKPHTAYVWLKLGLVFSQWTRQESEGLLTGCVSSIAVVAMFNSILSVWLASVEALLAGAILQ